MRRILLPALCWVLAISPLFAQRTSAHPERSLLLSWANILKKAPDISGVPAAAAPVDLLLTTVTEPSSGELRLDSTVSFFGYNIVSVSDSFPLFRSMYTYPQPGVKVVEEAMFEFDTWLPANRLTTVSDDLDRLVESRSEFFDFGTQSWIPESRAVFFPRGQSGDLPDSLIAYAWSADLNDWVKFLTTRNHFDDEGRLSVSLSTFDAFGQSFSFKDVYTYDAKGHLILIETFSVIGNDEYLTDRRILEYVDDRLASVIAQMVDASGTSVPASRITYTYTDFGKEETVDSYQWEMAINDWFRTESNYYAYDADKRVAALETTFFGRETPEERERFTYTYVQDNDLALETRYFFDPQINDFLLSDRTYFYYTDLLSGLKPEPVIVRDLHLAPNPVVDLVSIRLDQDAFLEVFSLSGQLVHRQTLSQGDNNLDFSGLPAGIYQLLARTGDGLHAGRMVKR